LNEESGITTIDPVSGNDGTLNNMDNADWVNSTIPLGKGFADSQTEATGTVFFSNTGLSMSFNAQNGAEITVSRIDTMPNLNPTEPFEVYDDQYWVVNRFGGGAFNADVTFTVNESISSQFAAQPHYFKLYKRNSNSDENWVYLADASAFDPSWGEITFSGITTPGQFMIGYQFPQVDYYSGTCLEFDGTNDIARSSDEYPA